ncbi:BTB/POZ domain-containing protein [Colletotrichum godetiae]|uniref:BTB/POZ domain-containing protein n=1 Tax=Colletotrichum godetiae TaxID=1209918 RepID=A0AAJ0AM24_9PEZI|nr:BTB/POZ domain-containing protein [Colletotrichum godetiae]KAK1675725.1 BTB/POZ domain-containing protein [Colletotrichum godetiae]
MSHLLWKFYWENDVDRFRRLLVPAGHTAQTVTRSPGIGAGPLGGSPGQYGTSPRNVKQRKSSAVGFGTTGSKNANNALGRAEINSRDHAGLTVLLRAASSTDSAAILFVQALLDHPSIDLYVQDPESGWNALHRALYCGNIAIARLLLERERKILTEQTLGISVAKVGQLIKTKDREGNSPFDLYNSTIAVRTLGDSGNPDDSDVDSDTDSSSDGGQALMRSVAALDGGAEGEEIFVFGSNRNISLGVGDEDDRQYPERINLKRPDQLVRRFFQEYLEKTKSGPQGANLPDEDMDLEEIPALIRNRPLRIHDAVLSKLHTAILTTDPVSNLYICGVGRGGRLGLGDENTQYRFVPVQGGLADKKVVQVALGQNHTLAVTDAGELWTWGSNSNSQLGYSLSPPARQDEEPMSTTPRQVFGTLKKEVILGIAASAVHSVAHTSSSLFCWGKNLGQLALMDADSRSLEVQQTPRKVAASLFSSPIAAVSAIDKATTVLLADSTVCVFTSYGYNFVKFPSPDVFVNHQFTTSMSTRYSAARNQVSRITSGGETIAAVTTRGDLFTMALIQKPDATTAATSTTNPAKIKGAVTTPQCVWNARKDGVKSASVGEHGAVIICTESGAVWRRIKRAKAKDAATPGSADIKRKDFKFQRVPSVTNAVAVRSSTFGAFAAIRKDCDVMKEQISINEQSLWEDFASLFALRDFQASTPGAGDKDTIGFWKAEDLKYRIGELPYEFLKSVDLERDLQQFLLMYPNSDVDMELSTSTCPDVKIPVHSWILTARSSVLRSLLSDYRNGGLGEIPQVLSLEEEDGRTIITLDSVDLLSLVNLAVYLYDDTVVPAWNHTRQAPALAHRYRQVRLELMKLATKLDMVKLESAVRLQTTVEKSLDKDFSKAIQDVRYFEDADALVELDGEEVPVHSQLLRQRCEFFEGLFHGRAGGMWLAGRRDELDEEELIRVDLSHCDPEAFQYVLRYLYADVGTELFNQTTSANIDDFSDLVMGVMSIANELMLDRLSQICQFIIARFANTRNIALLLNEISACAVTEFKDAGLEYVCLQMEAVLENHFLDDLEEDLLEELDNIVRENQLARYPFARSGRAELLLFEKDPDLALDIDEERRRRVREMAFRTTQRDDEKKISSSFKTKFGSLEDLSGVTSPSVDKSRRKSKTGRNEPFSPSLRPKESHADLMFNMDDEGPSALGSPTMSPTHRAAEARSQSEMDRIPSLSSPWKDTKVQAGSPQYPVQSPPTGTSAQFGMSPSPTDSRGPSAQRSGSPWAAAAFPTQKMDLRRVLTETPTKSALSAGIAAQKTKEASPKPAQPKVSQKERKKQQMAQAAAQAALEAEVLQPKAAWDKEAAGNKPAPWKPVASGPKTSLKDTLAKDSAKPVSPLADNPNSKELLSVEGSARSSPRRAASPDTRFPGQSRVNNSSSAMAGASSTSQPTSKPLVPHSKSYITPANKAEPILGLSMADIIGQQKREQEIVKEAVAKRSMQEIQQEQEFQEWWDQETRRVQEEEARRETKDKAAREGRAQKDGGGGGGGSSGSSKRGRRGRGVAKGKAAGGASLGQEHGTAAAAGNVDAGGVHPSAKAPGGPANNSRGRGHRGRGRGGKASTSAAASAM